MPEQNYSQVMSALRSKSASPAALARVYLLHGSDDALKREVTQALMGLALDPEFRDFDSSSIDFGPAGGDDGGDPILAITSSAAAAPFMSPRRVVVATGIQRLPSERQSALAQALGSLGALTLLILVADAPEIEAGRPKGRGIDAALRRAAAAHGIVVNCESPQAADLRGRAQQLFAEWDIKADPAACSGVAEYASTVSANAGSGAVAVLTRECEKLRAYVGEKAAVSPADVSALIPAVAQENIFRLLDCVGTRNTQEALKQLDAILLAGDKPDAVAARTFVMLQRHIRMLMLGKYASERRTKSEGSEPGQILTSELASTLSGQAYRLQSYSRQAANFTWDELAWASMRVLASDMGMKGMNVPPCLGASSPVLADEPVANLRLLVVQLCARK